MQRKLRKNKLNPRNTVELTKTMKETKNVRLRRNKNKPSKIT